MENIVMKNSSFKAASNKDKESNIGCSSVCVNYQDKVKKLLQLL